MGFSVNPPPTPPSKEDAEAAARDAGETASNVVDNLADGDVAGAVDAADGTEDGTAASDDPPPPPAPAGRIVLPDGTTVALDPIGGPDDLLSGDVTVTSGDDSVTISQPPLPDAGGVPALETPVGAFPDVAVTPTPAGPVPIPYPNVPGGEAGPPKGRGRPRAKDGEDQDDDNQGGGDTAWGTGALARSADRTRHPIADDVDDGARHQVIASADSEPLVYDVTDPPKAMEGDDDPSDLAYDGDGDGVALIAEDRIAIAEAPLDPTD